MSKVVVTGGVGYVGRELVAQLAINPDTEIHVIDTLESGEHRLAMMDADRFRLHRVDIRDANSLTNIMKLVKPDVIYHLAAIHYIPLCEKNPTLAVEVNVCGTMNLLNSAPEGARFVFASSAAVYRPSDYAHVENTSELGPMDIYGWTKQHGEEYVNYFHQSKKIHGINVRLFNVVGSGETNPHLAPDIISQLDNGIKNISLGNLFPKRDYINVSDVAEGFRRLAKLDVDSADATVCNLGTGRAHEVGEMVQFIADATGEEINITTDQSRVRAVDRPMLMASTERLHSYTDWQPTITLHQSMVEAWKTRSEDKLA